jgi:hypothetical protein
VGGLLAHHRSGHGRPHRAAGADVAGRDGGDLLVGKRSPLGDYSVHGRGGKGLQTGTEQLLWCGVATDLHTGGKEPAVLRPVDLPQAHRNGAGRPVGTTGAGPVVGEQAAHDQE